MQELDIQQGFPPDPELGKRNRGSERHPLRIDQRGKTGANSTTRDPPGRLPRIPRNTLSEHRMPPAKNASGSFSSWRRMSRLTIAELDANSATRVRRYTSSCPVACGNRACRASSETKVMTGTCMIQGRSQVFFSTGREKLSNPRRMLPRIISVIPTLSGARRGMPRPYIVCFAAAGHIRPAAREMAGSQLAAG